jgi:hypothetical protein
LFGFILVSVWFLFGFILVSVWFLFGSVSVVEMAVQEKEKATNPLELVA